MARRVSRSANHLTRRGLSFVILEANRRVGDSWRRRWDSLRLFTPARFDGIAGMPFLAAPHSFPRKDRPLLEGGRVLEAANAHRRGIVAGEPGLCFVGLHFLYAMSSVMIHGVGRDAERIAETIRSRARLG